MADDTVDSMSSSEKHPKGKRKRTAYDLYPSI
jgi:hypothetical protein